jgi:hypothetical protein
VRKEQNKKETFLVFSFDYSRRATEFHLNENDNHNHNLNYYMNVEGVKQKTEPPSDSVNIFAKLSFAESIVV